MFPAACNSSPSHEGGGAIVVDYAHTPDALATVLTALRPHARGRLVVLFGCGGDRDAGKRPLMGEVATRLADRVYVTDDNPRTEPPAEIRRAILDGGAERDRDRRPPRGDRDGDCRAARRAISWSSPARGTKPARSSAPRPIPSTTPRSRVNSRGESPAVIPSAGRLMTALWTAADAAAATGGSSADGVGRDRGLDRHPQPGRRAICSSRCAAPTTTATILSRLRCERGAAAAMVDREIPQLPAASPLLRVADTLAGLAALGAAGRNRSRARIVAVTGSVGKTGTKEALRLALASSGPTYASAGGLNNHWGAPLSLARLPPDAGYGVFELGMNHPGEIADLTRLVRPHIAVITTVEPVHLGFFPSVEAIADAKAEIFLGLEPGGIAVLNRDNPHYARLAAAAKRAGAVEILGFGAHPEAAARLVDCVLDSRGSTVEAAVCGTMLRFRLPVPGRHWVMNALAVLAAAQAAGAAVDRAADGAGRARSRCRAAVGATNSPGAAAP